MSEISRRGVLKGLALIVTGLPMISGDSAYSQSRQIRQEDIFASYDEFADALINKRQGDDYLRKLEYAHNNPNAVIQLFDKNRRKKFDDLKKFYYPPPKVVHSLDKGFPSGIEFNFMGNSFETSVAPAFALKEELGSQLKIDAANPDTSDLVVITILAYDSSDFLHRTGKSKKVYDIERNIFTRKQEIINMGFQNFSRNYKKGTGTSSRHSRQVPFPSPPLSDPTVPSSGSFGPKTLPPQAPHIP